MNQQSNALKAGLFVIAGIALSLLVIFLLTDVGRLFQRQQQVRVVITLADGLRGLKEGSFVSLGDQQIGMVSAIQDQLKDNRIVGKIAVLSIPAHYQLSNDARVEVVVPTFGTGTRLNITSVGTGEPYTTEHLIPVGLAPNPLAGQFVEELGIGDQQRRQLQEVIANIRDASGELRTQLPAVAGKLSDIAKKIEPMVANAGPAMDDAKATLANVKDITSQFRERTPGWTKRVDDITQNTQAATASVQAILKDKDDQIRGVIDHTHAITANFREKTMVEVDTAVARGSAAMENLRKSSQEIRGLIAGQRPIVERALANAELTTDQLKLAAVEVRRSPWRLMYKPGDEELETDNLYDAARSFALAASALDAAANTLNAVSKDQENPEQVKRALDHLGARFESFEQAEEAFWKALKDRSPR